MYLFQLRTFGVLESTCAVGVANAESYRFTVAEHYDKGTADKAEGLRVGDGATLVLDEYGTVGKKEFSL